MTRAIINFLRDLIAAMGRGFHADNTVRHLDWPKRIREDDK